MSIVSERSARHPTVTQGDQVGANLLLAQRIGRTPIMRGQPAHRGDVASLRPQPQSPQLHVFDHALTQRRHQRSPLVTTAQAKAAEPHQRILKSSYRRRPAPLGEAVSPSAHCRRPQTGHHFAPYVDKRTGFPLEQQDRRKRIGPLRGGLKNPFGSTRKVSPRGDGRDGDRADRDGGDRPCVDQHAELPMAAPSSERTLSCGQRDETKSR